MSMSQADFREAVLKTAGEAWWAEPCALKDWLEQGPEPQGARVFALEHTVFAAHFPQWFGNLVANCPDLAARRYMIENMYVEEVEDPTIHDNHLESMIKFGIGLGLSRDEIVSYSPSITMVMATHYWDNAARTKHWLEGFAAVGGLELTNSGELAARYGGTPINSRVHWAKLRLGEEHLTHWEAGEAADQGAGGHGDETIRILVEYARSEDLQQRALAALRESLEVFRYQYDTIGRMAFAASGRQAP